ncbi:MAG TPA: hypothetical protein VN896_11785 [Methylomirabilota bacterium]|jgi:hypothetical protein|nr:hypothetical protein [Methylomirabilota bacterium]
MAEAVSIRSWEAFYVIVGSSAGALTGLQFVVLTMIAEARKARGGGGESIAAFGSPNVVHFCAALLISAICSAPWGGLAPPGIAIAVCGVCGVIYSLIVLRRTMRQQEYKPVLEDWTWHAALPLLAYAALVHAGWAVEHGTVDTLYVVGGATLLLVFIGIHNAWDTVMYITVVGLPGPTKPPDPTATSAPADALTPSKPGVPPSAAVSAGPTATTPRPGAA